MKEKDKIAIFWFRRDLRLQDNVGLFHALASGFSVLPVFIFDPNILEKLYDRYDRRVDYIYQALSALNNELKKYGSKLTVFKDDPFEVFECLNQKYNIVGVFCNRDYEPDAIKRDTVIYQYCLNKGIAFKAFKDQTIFDKNDVVKKDGTAYTVYTAYAKQWREKLCAKDYKVYSSDFNKFYPQQFEILPEIGDVGFEKTDMVFIKPTLDLAIIADYDKYRDFPALEHTTQLGIALRFGTISIRECVAFSLQYNDTWLNELIWRDFFMQILYHYPKVVNQAFKSKYNAIRWRNDEREFELWCQGLTGFPLVDAGMRQLNQTGYMHNRVRMICASFLCKHLLIDWRWGESYFAQKLIDYDLAANNGNWQWASGSGCDSAPYFRVFNPSLQMNRFDKDLTYVRQWLPELGTNNYPEPIVDHTFARERAVRVYSEAVKEYK